MNYALLFDVANALVLPQWLLMVFAPRWSGTRWLRRSLLIPVALGILYAFLLGFGSAAPGGGLDFAAFGSLAGIKKLFGSGSDPLLLAGWVHYLAFDLLAGSFVLRDSQKRRIGHGWIVVPLAFCFMLGPVGLVLYWLVRVVKTGSLVGEEE
jgi:hypothetical protein